MKQQSETKRCAYCGRGSESPEGDEVIMCDDCWEKERVRFVSDMLANRQ